MMENKSGIRPTHDKVLLQPVEIEAKSAGGIVIPQTTVDKEDMAQIHGIIVAAGETAWAMPELNGIEPGALVIHAKFAGLRYLGKDGVLYRMMRATEIVGEADGVYDKRLKASIPIPGGI